MSDRYQSLVHTPLGRLAVRHLGLPDPFPLERYVPGGPVVDGPVLLGGEGRLAKHIDETLGDLGVEVVDEPAEGQEPKALVFDASGLTTSERLVELQRFFSPVLRRLRPCGRVVVLGTPPEAAGSGRERVAQRALEGFTRSLAKEVGRGSTVQLVYAAHGAGGALASTLAFLLSPRSAYVSGQVVRVGAHGVTAPAERASDLAAPLTGKVAVVTGAGRGIGEQIARVLHRDGATVVGIDVPAAAGALQTVTGELGGDHLSLDITAKDAAQRIARHVEQRFGGVDVLVHNAGITRDRRLVNQQADRFASVVEVNLTAPERITAELLDRGLVRRNGRVVGVASIAGIAGNNGQTSYAASKAGVIGLVDALADELEDGITVNAVAPGFISTAMTDAMPFAAREVGRRLNSLAQAGLPVDVAETIAWFAHPASTAVSGNVVRVCGQMFLGA